MRYCEVVINEDKSQTNPCYDDVDILVVDPRNTCGAPAWAKLECGRWVCETHYDVFSPSGGIG